MTTNVTVKTSDWPAAVEQYSHYQSEGPKYKNGAHTWSTTFVHAKSEQIFVVTDTTSITVRELAKDATGLDSDGSPNNL